MDPELNKICGEVMATLPRDFQKAPSMGIVERLRAGTPWSNPVAGMCVSLTEDANKTMREAADTIEALAEALRFYATADRYKGPNMPPIPNDKYAPQNFPYCWDTMRDGGDIARAALRRVEEKV